MMKGSEKQINPASETQKAFLEIIENCQEMPENVRATLLKGANNQEDANFWLNAVTKCFPAKSLSESIEILKSKSYKDLVQGVATKENLIRPIWEAGK